MIGVWPRSYGANLPWSGLPLYDGVGFVYAQS